MFVALFFQLLGSMKFFKIKIWKKSQLNNKLQGHPFWCFCPLWVLCLCTAVTSGPGPLFREARPTRPRLDPQPHSPGPLAGDQLLACGITRVIPIIPSFHSSSCLSAHPSEPNSPTGPQEKSRLTNESLNSTNPDTQGLSTSHGSDWLLDLNTQRRRACGTGPDRSQSRVITPTPPWATGSNPGFASRWLRVNWPLSPHLASLLPQLLLTKGGDNTFWPCVTL